jgi:hypothetical protein
MTGAYSLYRITPAVMQASFSLDVFWTTALLVTSYELINFLNKAAFSNHFAHFMIFGFRDFPVIHDSIKHAI